MCYTTEPLSEPIQQPQRVVITGGAGYLGHRLGLNIAANHPELGTIVLFDVRKPNGVLPKGVEAVVGDLRNEADVIAALKGATLVFHIASYGMTGMETMHDDRIYSINVQGTQNLLKACQVHGVQRLVYVSSYNAVFDGRTPIVNGTEETTSYVTEEATNNAYSVTKAIAEQAVLAADGISVTSSDLSRPARLRTCALRPGGIWGPGEMRHIPRIVNLARSGLLQVGFGDPNALVDWVHADNFINAMLLAAKGLQGDCVAGGRSYFIHDGKPSNSFDFMQPIFESMGYRWPKYRLPYVLVYIIAAIMEVVCEVARNVCGHVVWVPILSRMEVAKCAVSHYAKCDRARKELGYEPKDFDKVEVAKWYKEHGYGPQPVSPEVVAQRTIRLIRVLLALVFVAVLLAAWRNNAQQSSDLGSQLVAQAGLGLSVTGGPKGTAEL